MAYKQGGRWTYIVHFFPAWIVCTGLVVFICVRFELPNILHDYDLRLESIDDDLLNVTAFSLSGVDFSRLEAIDITLRDDLPVSVSLIPDRRNERFAFARLSTLISQTTGYLSFDRGVTEIRQKIDPTDGRARSFSVRFDPRLLPQPAERLEILYNPGYGFLEHRSLSLAIDKMILRFADGRVQSIHMSSLPPWPMAAGAGALLALLLLAVEHRFLWRKLRRQSAFFRHRTAQVVGGTALLALAGPAGTGVSISPMGFVFGFMLFVFIWFAFGCYPLPLLFHIPRPQWVEKLLFPVILTALGALLLTAPVLLLWTLNGDFDASTKIFRDNPPVTDDAAHPVVLCLGGSSTRGFPFSDKWPYTYTAFLRDFLRENFPAAKVINGGVDGACLDKILPILPELLARYRPQIVSFNFTNNDLTVSRQTPVTDWYPPLLRLAAETVGKYGAQPVFILEPSYAGVYLDLDEVQEGLTEIRAIHHGLDLILVDPYPEFLDRRESFLFVDDQVHLNRFGNELLANIMNERLEPLLSRD